MNSYIKVKPHSHRKYRILQKYLAACEKFSNKYQNFVYIDTHGGSGKVLDVSKNQLDDGSILIVAKIKPSFSCCVVEVDRLRCTLLKDCVRDYPNVTVFYGDCNVHIDKILRMIPEGQKFVLCFSDPDGLVYRGKGGFSCPQLTWKTIDKITHFQRTELLLNLPLEAIMREAAYILNNPDSSVSHSMEVTLTNFFGSDKWKSVEPGDYKTWLRVYLSERLENGDKDRYSYIGAILVRDSYTRAPLYYLVYASKYWLGGKIMRDIMRREFYGETKPLIEQPYERFIYED